MKEFLLAAALVVLGTSAASASTLCAQGTVAGAFTSTLNLSAVNTCTIGSTTFSNFFVTPNTPSAGLPTNFGTTVNLLDDGHTLSLTYSNIGSGDIQFGFQSSGVIPYGVLLGSGSASTVSETMCSTPYVGESCNGTALGGIGTATFGNNAFILITGGGGSGTVYFSKDILGGSGVTQTFVPEPTTISLMGAGLIGLGLLRRK
jgi:hypothetical protein